MSSATRNGGLSGPPGNPSRRNFPLARQLLQLPGRRRPEGNPSTGAVEPTARSRNGYNHVRASQSQCLDPVPGRRPPGDDGTADGIDVRVPELRRGRRGRGRRSDADGDLSGLFAGAPATSRGIRRGRPAVVRLVRAPRPLPPERLPPGPGPGDRDRRVRDQHRLLVLRDADPGVPGPAGVGLARHGPVLPGARRHDLLPLSRPVPRRGVEPGGPVPSRSTWRSASVTARSGCGPSSCASEGRRPTRPLLPDPSLGYASRVGRPSRLGNAEAADPKPWTSAARGFTTTCEGSSRASCSSSRSSARPTRTTPASTRSTRWAWSSRGPRHDVVTVVRYAAENEHRRFTREGRGRALAGESLGPGLVIDFSRHFRRIVDHRARDAWSCSRGWCSTSSTRSWPRWVGGSGPTRTARRSCTIGGMIGLDAAGPAVASVRDDRRPRRAAPRRLRQRRDRRAGREPLARLRRRAAPTSRAWSSASSARWSAAAARRSRGRPPGRPRNRAGYALERAATSDGHPPGAAARRLGGDAGAGDRGHAADRRRSRRRRRWWSCRSRRIGDAAAAVPRLPRRRRPRSATSTTGARSAWSATPCPAFRDWIAEAAESVLIVEFEGDDPDEVARQVRRAGRPRSIRRGRLVADPVEVSRRADCERLLGLRRAVEPLLMRMRGRRAPVPFIDDVAVPPEALPEFLQRLQNILKQHDVSWTLDAHAGQGQLHARPFLDLADPRDVAKLEPLATQVYEAALGARRHDLGRARLRAGPDPVPPPPVSASWSRSSARSRTPSTRSTCSTPARSSATTRT